MQDPRKAFVTPNPSQAGGIFNGLVKPRNFIEAVVIALILFLIVYKGMTKLLPGTICIVVGTVLILPAFMLALIGIHGVPLTTWLSDQIIFEMTKCYVTIKMPLPKDRKAFWEIYEREKEKFDE